MHSANPSGPAPGSGHTTQSKRPAKTAESLELEEEVARWELDAREIQLGAKIGKGAFGVVFKGTLRGKEVAVKKLHATELDEDTLENFRKEVAILSKLRHPNVLLFMGACTQPGNLIIVTEFMERGSVYDLLHDKNEKLPFKLRMKWAKEAALGMNWLHCSKPVFIHRDLKTGNLLVDKNMNVKVSDFGLSHIKKKGGIGQKGSYGAIGTPLWMAPEVLLNKEYDESADLYSFGIVLWELLTQEDPFPNIQSLPEMLDQVCIANQRPPIPDSCPRTLRDTISQCWNPLPEKRPTFEHLLKTSIFDEIIMEASIGDTHGRNIWKKNFYSKDGIKEVVPDRDFLRALFLYFNKPLDGHRAVDDTAITCLRTLLVKNNNVSIEEFAKLLDWFGPLDSIDGFLGRMVDLLKKPWFHGDLSSDLAEKTIRKVSRKGAYLVRFSSRDPGCYAITTLAKDSKLKHYKVLHKPGAGYLVGKIETHTLEELVTKYRGELYLKHAAPGSPYAEIFQRAPSTPSIGYQAVGVDP